MTAGPPENERLRREAGVLPRAELTDDQREAADRILQALGEMARRVEAPDDGATSEPEYVPRILSRTHNQALLIDGGRGSGKTALLLTLLDLLKREHLQQPSPPEWPDAAWRRKLVVPLGIIDLQPLSGQANLLLQIAGRLRQVVAPLSAGSSAELPGPWTPTSGPTLASSVAWQRFLTVAALSHGSLEARRGRLDPEAYVEELELAEQQRFDVRGAFAQLVEAVARDAHARLWPGRPGSPLFVLPIDDADLNPDLSSELVRLLRTVAHARVVVLVAGEQGVFLDALAQRFARERASGAGPASPEARPEVLAREFFRKVFAEAQTQRLAPLSAGARIELFRQQLGSLAAELEVPTDNPRLADQTLLGYIAVAPDSLAPALPDRLRPLIDLAAATRAICAREPAPQRAKRLAHVLFARALDEAGPLPGETHERLAEVVTLDQEQLVVDGTPLRSGPVWRTLATATTRTGLRFSAIRWVRYQFQEAASGRLLSPALAGAYRLARWLAYDGPEDTVIRDPSGHGLDLSTATVRCESQLPESGLEVPWPTPDWESLDRMLFSQAWVAWVEGLPSGAAIDVDSAARAFLTLLVEVARTRQRGPSEPLDWRALAQAVVALQPAPATTRGRLLQGWAQGRAGLLAAPESGLSAVAANEWLGALEAAALAGPEGERTWAGMREALARERRLRLRLALKGRVEESQLDESVGQILGNLDGRYPDFLWSVLVAGQGTVPQRAFVELLGRRVVRHPPARRLSRPATVEGYLVGWRRRELERGPSALLEALRRTLAGQDQRSGLPVSSALRELWLAALTETNRGALKEWLGAGPAPAVPRQIFRLREEGHQRRTLGPVVVDAPLVDQRSPLEPVPSVAVKRDVSPVLQTLAELFVDVSADEQDLPGPAPTTDAWWRFCRLPEAGHAPGGATWLWPAVDWPAPYDWTLVVRSWSEWLLVANDDASLLARPGAVDALAHHYVSSQLAVARGRETPPATPWDGEVYPEYWVSLLKEILAAKRSHHPGSRAGRFVEWCQSLGLLAAPESGLQPPVADVILTVLGGADQLAGLRALRVARAAALFPADARVLGRLDAGHPDHPWIRRVNRVSAKPRRASARATASRKKR